MQGATGCFFAKKAARLPCPTQKKPRRSMLRRGKVFLTFQFYLTVKVAAEVVTVPASFVTWQRYI